MAISTPATDYGVVVMDRDECVKRSLHWLGIAEEGYVEGPVTLGSAANLFARPAVAASIANAYASLALTASTDADRVEQLSNGNR